ncbi:MAG: hypothetical protein ACLQHK_05165 [Gallionellaceae bacterium]
MALQLFHFFEFYAFGRRNTEMLELIWKESSRRCFRKNQEGRINTAPWNWRGWHIAPTA